MLCGYGVTLGERASSVVAVLRGALCRYAAGGESAALEAHPIGAAVHRLCPPLDDLVRIAAFVPVLEARARRSLWALGLKSLSVGTETAY